MAVKKKGVCSMTHAYKCNKCQMFFEALYITKFVLNATSYGETPEYHLCNKCTDEFKVWLK